MNEYFYRLAPAVLAITGAIFGLCGYFIDRYAPLEAKLSLWMAAILILTAIGTLLGSLIRKLHGHSYKDALTGLQNRRYFYIRLQHEMERLKRYRLPLSLIIIDVDNFKNINDTYGHVEGDRVLTELANIFQAHARAGDTVVRWGGEEFALILPETDSRGAKAFAERIRTVVEACNSCYEVTICAGATCTTDEMDINRLVEIADSALYKAKQTKNNVVCVEGL